MAVVGGGVENGLRGGARIKMPIAREKSTGDGAGSARESRHNVVKSDSLRIAYHAQMAAIPIETVGEGPLSGSRSSRSEANATWVLNGPSRSSLRTDGHTASPNGRSAIRGSIASSRKLRLGVRLSMRAFAL